MPKPDLVPLTGGYRRIPVLQIGADVYCDSQLIARVLERVQPEPTLFPGGSEGLCFALHFWADRLLFQAAVPVVFEKIAASVPKEFIEDRTRMMGGGDFGAFVRAAPLFADALRSHAALLDTQLADGRPFLLGEEPSLADFVGYHPIWFLRAVPPTRDRLAEFERLTAWAERVADVGHGVRDEWTPAEALRIARESRPADSGGTDPRDPRGLRRGDKVRVVPDDYGFDPVEGELVGSDVHEVAVCRSTPELGEVVVHFPRAGFRVQTA
jgi:glutathione S-transferase